MADVTGEADGRKYVVETIQANRLDIDPGVQRPPNPARIAHLADTFQESALGVFTVSRRGGGRAGERNIVLDGQTRLLALRRFTGTDDTAYPVACQVYVNLTRQEEADLFLRHNDRAAIKPYDRYRIALVAGEKWAVEINDVVTRHGFTVDLGAPPERRFTAVAAADRIRRTGAQGLTVLDKAFDLAVRAWGHSSNTASVDSINGLALTVQRHGNDLDVLRLSTVLARAGNPRAFIGNVAQLRSALNVRRPEAAYHHVLALYNKGLRSGRLEPQR